jgi:hypothetical protein
MTSPRRGRGRRNPKRGEPPLIFLHLNPEKNKGLIGIGLMKEEGISPSFLAIKESVMGKDFFEIADAVADAMIESSERERERKRRQKRRDLGERIVDAIDGTANDPKSQLRRMKLRLAEIEDSYDWEDRKEARVLKKKIQVLQDEVD